jgi:hypothetical protein
MPALVPASKDGGYGHDIHAVDDPRDVTARTTKGALGS